jgi:hypothetical protein
MLKSYWWTSELGSRSHCVACLSQIDSKVQRALYFENEGALKFSGTAKPSAPSAALKNCFPPRKHWQGDARDAPPGAFSSDGLKWW